MRPIIIDTDPGIDDAIAIAIAAFSNELDIKLISTVAGNVSLEKVTQNALKLLALFKKDIPVAMGAKAALIEEFVDAANVHGLSGMDGYDFPEAKEELLLKEHAVIALRDCILNSKEKITLVPIAPLTNIALLFTIFPEVKQNIKEIVLMGGSLSRGNKGVMSEFNFASDPEAAKIVFNSKLPIVMAGLDVGLKALVMPSDMQEIQNFGEVGKMAYALFKKYRGGSFNTGLKMYDSCAIAYLLKPELFSISECFVDIELNNGLTRGCSVVDLKNYLNKQANAKVCVDINQDEFRKWFLAAMKKCI
ncbi:ribonucleoside hydrolase RihC [Campylobacter canadensis]|uniref:Ribonucleoside hydrolase RihC n=1 Tax=Campylobacter canadensis TaxID=449520 RepID=A0ABS7WSF1_9BACT|nr:ribonucleoside hydrolase RihC [Campylobacter canadensis]MBZ7986874.1 ribonucleoside hydrolase RihC [Campylobacter canadensis]MBZ7994195.1 ribonucleoside hydrolase RihC [Campylobacter canadensis]MBZ7995812.1 ribonucleoside hydrolase RihC [Campylobacter canadensis]MBZ7997911.1 ribonucleoside hydrolase RihC [Campylobacter canadensis]MBZ7999527.1 ribonucleoside hydrolase RihC [Campylobacter canadensis]